VEIEKRQIVLQVALSLKFMKHRSKEIIAFNMVELMVVIAIISIMMALLLPALKSVRERMKSIQCVNNLKQITFAAFTYANDNNGCVPPYLDSGPPILVWSSCLHNGGYLPVRLGPSPDDARPLWGKSSYVCPSNPWLWSWRLNYAWNRYLAPPGYGGIQNSSTQLAYWPQPANKAMVMDEGATSGADCGYSLDNSSPAYRVNPTWHSGGGNIAFLDGSVRWVPATTDKTQFFQP
jgi:prepilin-type processing-associated H-X9-DG protein/prepilin-type N-terminal cleavage/methylation domain-containing protein